MQSDVAARIGVLQAQISSLNQQIAGARKAKLQELTEERDRAQGELDLRNAMHDALGQMAKFTSTNGESGQSGLRRQHRRIAEFGSGAFRRRRRQDRRQDTTTAPAAPCRPPTA